MSVIPNPTPIRIVLEDISQRTTVCSGSNGDSIVLLIVNDSMSFGFTPMPNPILGQDGDKRIAEALFQKIRLCYCKFMVQSVSRMFSGFMEILYHAFGWLHNP